MHLNIRIYNIQNDFPPSKQSGASEASTYTSVTLRLSNPAYFYTMFAKDPPLPEKAANHRRCHQITQTHESDTLKTTYINGLSVKNTAPAKS